MLLWVIAVPFLLSSPWLPLLAAERRWLRNAAGCGTPLAAERRWLRNAAGCGTPLATPAGADPGRTADHNVSPIPVGKMMRAAPPTPTMIQAQARRQEGKPWPSFQYCRKRLYNRRVIRALVKVQRELKTL